MRNLFTALSLSITCLQANHHLVHASSDQRRPYQPPKAGSFRPRSQISRVENYQYAAPHNPAGGDSNTGENDGRPTLHDLHRLSDPTEPLENPLTKKTSRGGLFSWFNEIDVHILRSTLPLSAVFAIMPLVVSSNLFWVNRLGDTLAVAGQSAANQVYTSSFWLFSFLPSVTATLVSKSHAAGDIEATQDHVCQALLFAILISIAGTAIMFFNPAKILGSVLKDGAPALQHAIPFLRIRAFSFLPMLISFVGFSTFRGVMEVGTAVKVALAANFVTIVLDPVFIHVLGLGVRGSAFAAVSGDVVNSMIYFRLLRSKNFIRWEKISRLPSWRSIAPLLEGGIALQIRSFVINLTQLMVTRVIQSIDETGVAPAAHALAIQTFMMGGIFLGAIGMATQTMIPNAIQNTKDQTVNNANGSVPYVQALTRRLLQWGVGVGVIIGVLEFLFLPVLLKSSPLSEVREAARIPALISISFQWINGLVNVGEGVMMGNGCFIRLATNMIVAAIGYVGALQVFPNMLGLTGVWCSLGIFVLLRATGVFTFLLSQRTRNRSDFLKSAPKS